MALSSLPSFRWADAASEQTRAEEPARPALYCRSCERSGWGIVLAPTGQKEKDDQTHVRRDRKTGDWKMAYSRSSILTGRSRKV